MPVAGGLEDGMRDFKQRMEAAARRGANKAGLRWLNDCINELPGVPIDEGALRGSGSAFVDADCISEKQATRSRAEKPGAARVSKGQEAGRPATQLDELSFKEGELVITVGFNSPYAAYQHEGVRKDGTHVVKNYSDPDTGAKFIEKKLAYGEDYTGIVAAEMKGVAGA